MKLNYRKITQNAYDVAIKEYQEATDNDLMGLEDKLIKLLEFKSLKSLQDQTLLEIGFGVGRDIRYFLKHSLQKDNYEGIDISSEMVKYCKSKFPNLNFVQKDILEMNYSNEKFDIFWALASFLHLSPQDMAKALTKLYSSIKTGGVGLISMRVKQGEDNIEPGIVISEKKGKVISRYFSFFTNRV